MAVEAEIKDAFSLFSLLACLGLDKEDVSVTSNKIQPSQMSASLGVGGIVLNVQ